MCWVLEPFFWETLNNETVLCEMKDSDGLRLTPGKRIGFFQVGKAASPKEETYNFTRPQNVITDEHFRDRLG